MEYLPAEQQQKIVKTYKTATLLVFAFAVSVLVYMLIARFIAPGESPPGSERWAKLIYSAVLVLGLGVVTLRRVLMSRAVMAQAARRGAQAVLNKLLTVTVIAAAVAEVVAILGLVFYLLTGEYEYSWRLGVISLLLLAYSFPRRGEWERAVAASVKAPAQ